MKKQQRRALLALLRSNKHEKFVLSSDMFDHDLSVPGCPDPVQILRNLFSPEHASALKVIGSKLDNLGRLSQRPRNRPLLPF